MKTIITIADVHFGALDPKYMYDALTEQFTKKLYNINFDILAICGDLFDSKFMSNNPIVMYCSYFIADLVELCKTKNACLLLLSGTSSHDNGQLSLFYHYMYDDDIDIRIVERIKYEYIKDLKILCIPELYGVEEKVYYEYLYKNAPYDICVMHGTINGSFKGSEIPTINSSHAPIFGINHFDGCYGPILAGHYHIPGCYSEHMYYNGSPLRFQFGEEQTKGFLITIYDEISHRYYCQLQPIDSLIYKTISIDSIIGNDPKVIIDHINQYKEKYGIDYLRVQYSTNPEIMNIVRAYFKNIKYVKLQDMGSSEKSSELAKSKIDESNSKYSFLNDPSIDDITKFVMYVNQQEGYTYITTEKLIELLGG